MRQATADNRRNRKKGCKTMKFKCLKCRKAYSGEPTRALMIDGVAIFRRDICYDDVLEINADLCAGCAQQVEAKLRPIFAWARRYKQGG